jgi:thiol:disulfide interchange protein DsbD
MDFARDISSLIQDNMLLALGFAFASGFVTSLTPCVYPVIGITVAVFGASEAKSRFRALALSCTFVAGLAVMYTTLGVVAGLTGMLFGSLMSNPWIIGAIAVLFVVLALGMFGVYEMQLPESVRNRLGRAGGIGFPGALVMGLVSGVVAAPCAGPMVSGILAYVGTTRSPVLGAVLLLAYSLGMGVLFVLVGTFAMSLPKSGKWLDGVKDLLGAVLLIVAAFFAWGAAGPLREVFPSSPVVLWTSVAGAAVGFTLVVLSHTTFHEGARWRYLAGRILGLVMLVLASAFTLYALMSHEPADELEWHTDVEAAVARAREEQRPYVMDFTAEWCAACKELENVTFTDADVAEELSGYVLIRLDMTQNDERDAALMEEHGVNGLPAVIVYRSDGSEVGRVTRFVEPQEFMEILEDVD